MPNADPRPVRRRRPRATPNKPEISLPRSIVASEEGPRNRHWRTYFLFHLIETSNISASAEAAKVSTSRVYRTRQDDPDFAAQFMAALAQGYLNLEMELLCYLRSPDPARKMDVANAIRLLTLHRQSVAQQRAQEDDRTEAEVLESIDAMIDQMRQRAAANTALLAGTDADDEPGE